MPATEELAPFELEGLRAADKVLYQDQAVLTYDQPQNDLAVRLEPNKAILQPLAVTFFGPDMEHQSMLTNLEEELTWDVEAMLGYTSIKVDHIGYRTGTAPLMDQSACPKGESIVMTLNQEVVIDLELIYYDLDDAALRPASKQELDKLVNYMNEVPYVGVELSSYTDSRGPKGTTTTCHKRVRKSAWTTSSRRAWPPRGLKQQAMERPSPSTSAWTACGATSACTRKTAAPELRFLAGS